MKKEKIIIMFGGISPEYEVSVITALQVLENIDREKYIPVPILLDKNGDFNLLKGLKDRKGIFKSSRKKVSFGHDNRGGYIRCGNRKIFAQSAYLAFHGGNGESGEVQGLLQSIAIPITSPPVESCVLTMNKNIQKILAKEEGIPVLEGYTVFSENIRADVDAVMEEVLEQLQFPLIIKPAHLGSSIGLQVANDRGQLLKGLMSCALLDREILIERFLENFNEYNCSVIEVDSKLECSLIERPLRKSDILTFKDKYQDENSSKNVNNSNVGGMANLVRELPAQISKEKEKEILQYAKRLYMTFRCKGLVRVDFIEDSNGNMFFNELNQIPGSMSFYLWEAAGISFKEQITRSIEESVSRNSKKQGYKIDYETDIIEKFINNKDL
jgi:D-alanine-D-alanine ligase